MSSFPSADDYIRAVQAPARVFSTPGLRAADFALHPLFQIPMPASGFSAVVFRARVDGIDRALRFFIRDDASNRPRYDALERYFAGHRLTDCVANPTWVDDAISVDSQRWPMVQMDWVNGRTLDEHIRFLVQNGDTAALRALADAWLRLVIRLQSAGFAHGDLQHGNVMVDQSGALRLVDFDGSWIPEFGTDAPPGETGHPNYQLVGRPWGRWMDTFSGLLIYTALIALSRSPSLWTRLSTDENILFLRDDFSAPFRTEAWTELAALHDDEIDRLSALIQRCCDTPAVAQALLRTIVGPTGDPGPHTKPAESPTGNEPHATPGTDDEPWWSTVQREAAARDARPAEPVGVPAAASVLTRDRARPDPSPNAAGLPAPPPPLVRTGPAWAGGVRSGGSRVAIALAVACALGLLVGIVVAAANKSSDQGVAAGLITIALAFGAAFTLLRTQR